MIQTDTIAHAVSDLSDARLAGETLPETIDLDDGSILRIVRDDSGETTGPQWSAQIDGRSYPL